MPPRPPWYAAGYVWYAAAVMAFYGMSLLGGWKAPQVDLGSGGGRSGGSYHSFGGK